MTEELNEINAAQADFGDEERIVFELTKALFEDFFHMSTNLSDDLVAVTSGFEEQCMYGITTLRRLSLRSSKSALISMNLCHLLSEHRAYTLLKKLAELEASVQQPSENLKDSVLGDMIANDKEFRRLLVLLEWCEENEKNNPDSIKKLDDELCALEHTAGIRAETLHNRKRGKKLCDLDLDGAKHGRLHGDDEDLQNRVYRATYMLLKCGKIDEACKVLSHCGLPALIPSLKFRNFARDSSLTPKSKDAPTYSLAESRALFKTTVTKILSMGDSFSPLESCIWSIVAGLLEPALSLSCRTEELLWCYANAAVECRIDAWLAEARKWECNTESCLSGSDLMVDSIFDEILTKERSPYYSSYRYFLTGDSSAHVDFMKDWLEKHPDSHYSHLLRFMVHTVLIYIHDKRDVNLENAHWVFECYIALLISVKMYSLVPFYASQLHPERRDYLLVRFMHTLEDERFRLEVLAAAHKAGLDTSALCKQVYSYCVKTNPVTNESFESDISLVNAWNWLTYPGKDLILDALIGANYILRRFFYFDKLKEAKMLLKQTSESVGALVENLWRENFPDRPIPKSLQVQVMEYNSYISYLEALNCFDNWFKQFALEKPIVPEKPSDDLWARMDIQQKAVFELQRKKMEEAKERYESNNTLLFRVAFSSLMNILRQPNGWLDCFLENDGEENRKEELNSIRERYIATTVTLLQTICEQSDEKLKAMEVLDVLADEDYKMTEILSKEQLGSFLRKFALFTGLTFNNSS